MSMPGQDPAGIGGLVRRSEVLIDLRRYDEAIRILRDAAAREPENAQVHCLFALAHLRSGRPADAVLSAERAASLAPAREWPHRLRSQALVAEARRAKPDEARRLGRLAVTAARESIRIAPMNERSFCAAAEAELAAGNLTGADEAAHRAIELAPNVADTWVAASQVAIKAKNWHAAESASRHALEIDPGNYGAINNLGVALQGSGRWQEAAVAFNRAARRDPRGEVARKNLTTTGLLVIRLVVLVALLPLLAVPGGVVLFLMASIGTNLYITRSPTRLARVNSWGTRLGIRMARSSSRVPIVPLLSAAFFFALVTAVLSLLTGVAVAATVSIIGCSVGVAGTVIKQSWRRRKGTRPVRPVELQSMLPEGPRYQIRTGILILLASVLWLTTVFSVTVALDPSSRGGAGGPAPSLVLGAISFALTWVIATRAGVGRRRPYRGPPRPD